MKKKETPPKQNPKKTKVFLTKPEEIRLLEKNIRFKLKNEKRMLFHKKIFLFAKLLILFVIWVCIFYILRVVFIMPILTMYNSALDLYIQTGNTELFAHAAQFAQTWQMTWGILGIAIILYVVVGYIYKRRLRNASKK